MPSSLKQESIEEGTWYNKWAMVERHETPFNGGLADQNKFSSPPWLAKEQSFFIRMCSMNLQPKQTNK